MDKVKLVMFYRLRQLYNALNPKIKEEELSWVERILSEKELLLFRKQVLTEQRHALDVAFDIISHRSEIILLVGEQAYDNLLKAALLHDCGKSLVKLRLWQRVFIVVYDFLPLRTKYYITGMKNVFSKTIVIHKQHPAWGRRLGTKIGLNHEILKLIENHHTPGSRLEKIIAQADSRH